MLDYIQQLSKRHDDVAQVDDLTVNTGRRVWPTLSFTLTQWSHSGYNIWGEVNTSSEGPTNVTCKQKEDGLHKTPVNAFTNDMNAAPVLALLTER